MNKKIKILIIYTDTVGGVGFYRSTQPHEKLIEMYPEEFEVDAMIQPNFNNLEMFKKYDIIHFHRGVYYTTNERQETFTKLLQFCKENNIVTVMDVDDHWKMGSEHPLYKLNLSTKRDNNCNNEDIIKNNLKTADYVTTTTELFADIIRQYNNNVIVLPNAIDPTDKRFIIDKKKSDKLRIGFIMSSTHEPDLETMNGFVGKLPKDVSDKIELVLCGFDNRGKIFLGYDENGVEKSRPMLPQEGVWYRYEKLITDNYRIISPQYREFLEKFIPDSVYPNAQQEGYKRCWTKDLNHYYQHYNEVDVLLAPLKDNEFNYVKSELKAIECCFSHTAFVGSNYGPYTIGLKSIFKKGGEIDMNGNAILIDKTRAHKDWSKAIEKLVKHPEYVKLLQDNLYRDFHEKYDLSTVTKQRAEFYKRIIKK